ncbi:hypothetical protein GGF50DRAFT_17419, partial [Schizophyllum commune]
PPPPPFMGGGQAPPPGPPAGGGGQGYVQQGPPGGGNGPPGGGPPGGYPQGSLPWAPAAPYGTQVPTIPPILKHDNVPAWNGDRSSAINYLWKITELERGGGYLSQALGYWLWQKLEAGSSVQLWYMTLEDSTKDWMQMNARNWMLGLVYGFLGRRWLTQLATEFKQQAFREGAKHRKESPHDFINRRILLARLLGYSRPGSREEVELLTERLPSHWHHMLSTTTILSTDELKNRALEFEEELLAESKHDSQNDLDGAIAAALKRLGVYPRSRVARNQFSKPSAFDVEAQPISHSNLDQDEECQDECSGEDDPLEEVIAAAYQVVQQRQPSKPASYPFKARNDVKTSAKKLPPSPCRACGSPNHWNRECPHNDDFLKKYRKESFVVEDAERDRAYNAAYAMVVAGQPDFEGAALDDEDESLGERKTQADEEEAEQKEVESAMTEMPCEVLFVNTSAVGSRIEVIEEEYWYEGGTLPCDHPHIMEYVGEEARHAYQPDEEEQEVLAVPDVRPYDDTPVRLRAKIKKPPGYASAGTSVLSVRGWLGSLEELEMDLRLDSCASLSLLSAECYDQLKDPPPIQQGAKMKLWQLTATSEPMRGYVRLPVFVAASDGTVLEMEVELYVVEGMTVPLLLGEDFQQAYEIAVDRRVDGTTVFFGLYPAPVPAVPVERTKDYSKVARSYVGEVPQQPFARRGHRKRLRRDQKRREALARAEDCVVRAAMDMTIQPESVASVPLRGPFPEKEEWMIEKSLLTSKDDQHFAVPNTIIHSDAPFVPVANLSNAPRKIRQGEIIGQITRASEYFDSPRSNVEFEKLQQHALFLKTVCDLNLGDLGRTEGVADSSPLRSEKGTRERVRLPDAASYAAWAAGQQPASRKFCMPSADAYGAWAQGEEDEQEDYGPKTAAMPEADEVKSSDFKSVLDVGALPPHLEERAWAMLEKHKAAFALDGRLGDHEARARIRTKEGVSPIAVPMFGASPAK